MRATTTEFPRHSPEIAAELWADSYDSRFHDRDRRTTAEGRNTRYLRDRREAVDMIAYWSHIAEQVKAGTP